MSNRNVAGGTFFGNTSATQVSTGSYDDYLNKMESIANSNNAIALQTAREQMGFQAEQALQAQKFNSEEAEKNRIWQEYMSNTSHQREVQDLIKAGLNPVLSANGGASTPSGSSASSAGLPQGAKASLDYSLVGALADFVTTSINSASSLRATYYSSDSSRSASKYTADLKFVGDMINGFLDLIPAVVDASMPSIPGLE